MHESVPAAPPEDLPIKHDHASPPNIEQVQPIPLMTFTLPTGCF